MRTPLFACLLPTLIFGCASGPHGPVRVRVTDAETGKALSGITVEAVGLSLGEGGEQAFDMWEIEHRIHDSWQDARELVTATTGLDGMASLSAPLSSGGTAIAARAEHYFAPDGKSFRDGKVLPLSQFAPAATRPAEVELSLLSGEIKAAKIILTVPVDYRGPILVRESDRIIPHQPGQVIFKLPANTSGVTDLPISPPRLLQANVIGLIVARPDGTVLPRERVPFFYRGRKPTLAPETVGLRAVEFGVMQHPYVAVYVVGNLADAEQYANQHGIGDWQVHLQETAVRKLFEP